MGDELKCEWNGFMSSMRCLMTGSIIGMVYEKCSMCEEV